MRLAGWEGRLERVIAEARDKDYRLGTHDCFSFSCSVVAALTGADRWPEFSGRYSTQREMRRLLVQHGSSFEAAGDWFFGSPSLDVRLAQRGDIVAVETPDRKKHLGVVTLDGSMVALLGVRGLVFVPVLTCLCCWRVGD